MSEAVDRVLRALEAKDCKPRKAGSGWSACCPAHEDRKASLSLSQGNKGALVHCHAGCAKADVIRALGLEARELFDDDGLGRVATVKPKSTKADKPKQVFRTMEDALAAYRRTFRGRHEAAMWPYHSADGEIVGYSVRWTMDDGTKEIRPISRVADGWIMGHMSAPRPLFNLPAVIASDTVVIVEGEKCAEALIDLGIVATTSVQGGNAKPEMTDWSPLAGRRVIVLPDHDETGEKYAFGSVAPSAHAAGATSVAVVRLANHWPECPAGGDIADWIEARGDAAEPDAIREEFERILAKAEPVSVEPVEIEQADDEAQDTDDGQSCGPANVHDQSTWSDVGFAKRVIAESNGQILYVADGGPRGHGGWYWFNKGRWEPDASGIGPMRFAKAAGRNLWDECHALGPDGPKALYQFVRRCNSEAGFRAAIRIAMSDESVEARMSDFDRDDYLLNCPNGILNLETGEFGPHDPSRRMTHMAGVAYDPSARCPQFEEHIEAVTGGDADLAEYLQREFGKTLSGAQSDNRLVFHAGSGSNGKSSTVAAISNAMGSYAGPFMADIVLVSKKEVDREIAAGKIVGLRFGYCQEIEGRGRTKLATAILKTLLSGDRQTFRRFFKDETRIKPTWHLHALVNDLPSIEGSEDDYATERRIRVVPWQCEFAGASERPREEVDRILASEAAGILAWLVRGYMDYRKNGLRPAAVVERATKDYLNGGRPDRERVREFVDEECIIDPRAVCLTKDLYQRYREWFGEGACDSAVFGRKLTLEKFGGSKSHGIAKRFGLRLRPAGEDGEDKPGFQTLYARENHFMVTG